MKIDLMGSIDIPDMERISCLEDLKNQYKKITFEMVDSLKYRDISCLFLEDSRIRIDKYLTDNGLMNSDDYIYDNIRDNVIKALENLNEDIIEKTEFYKYYENGVVAGYSFYITANIDMDKIIEIIEEDLKDDIDKN